MRKFIISAVLLALAVMLMACGATSGDVYAKEYEPSYVKYVSVDDYQYYCTPRLTTGANGQTTLTNDCSNHWVGSHREPRTVPECYKIMFMNTDGDKGRDCVGQDRYETISIGDFYQKD